MCGLVVFDRFPKTNSSTNYAFTEKRKQIKTLWKGRKWKTTRDEALGRFRQNQTAGKCGALNVRTKSCTAAKCTDHSFSTPLSLLHACLRGRAVFFARRWLARRVAVDGEVGSMRPTGILQDCTFISPSLPRKSESSHDARFLSTCSGPWLHSFTTAYQIRIYGKFNFLPYVLSNEKNAILRI